MALVSTRQAASHWLRRSLPAAVLVVGVSALAVLVPAQMVSAGTNAFTFSGKLTGTLKLIPADDCGGSSSNGTQLDDIAGKLKGSKGDQWTMTIFVPKNGTFKIKPPALGSSPTSTVTLETPGKNEPFSWDATGGSITLDGNSGSINVTLKGVTGGASGKVKIKGSWDCTT